MAVRSMYPHVFVGIPQSKVWSLGVCFVSALYSRDGK